MSFRRLLSLVPVLVLVPVVSACASSGGMSSGGGGETAAAAGNADANGGSTTVILRTQLATYAGRTAREAVDRFNRRWLRAQRGAAGGGAAFARVVIEGRMRDTLDALNRLRTDEIESMRFLDPQAAIRKYGAEFTGGAIEVTLRRR